MPKTQSAPCVVNERNIRDAFLGLNPLPLAHGNQCHCLMMQMLVKGQSISPPKAIVSKHWTTLLCK